MSDSEIVETTGNFHDEVVKAGEMIAEDIFDNVAALNAGDNMLNDDAGRGNELVDEAFINVQGTIARLFLGLIGDDTFWVIALKAGVLEEFGALGEAIAFLIADPFIMAAAGIGCA